MESVEGGAAVLAEFRKLSDKPIEAIIYTHNHTDHVFGSIAFSDSEKQPKVYAHASTQYYIDRLVNVTRPIIQTRSTRMFGTRLTDDELINAGIGPKLALSSHSHVHAMPPTVTFEDSLKTTIAGIDIELYHAPGETEDQLFVWLPEKGVLLPGDNIYKAFPNLYTIRGTHYRDVNQWVSSIDLMRKFNAAHLVPSHSRPISGKQEILDLLINYRDGIAFVHDQTLRYMNLGMTVDEIVEQVKLPPHLIDQPYLQEFYGSVEWSVRAIFSGYLGWFDGNASTLYPLNNREKADRLASMLGGFTELEKAAEKALDSDDLQWALELSDLLMANDAHKDKGRAIKISALRKLAAQQSNPNARHYYFTQAIELEEQEVVSIKPVPTEDYLRSIDLDGIFQSMAVSLKAEETYEVEKVVDFIFPDSDKVYSITVRRGIAEIKKQASDSPDLTVELDSYVWKRIVSKLSSPLVHYAKGDIRISGSKLELISFLDMFESQ